MNVFTTGCVQAVKYVEDGQKNTGYVAYVYGQ